MVLKMHENGATLEFISKTSELSEQEILNIINKDAQASFFKHILFLIYINFYKWYNIKWQVNMKKLSVLIKRGILLNILILLWNLLCMIM